MLVEHGGRRYMASVPLAASPQISVSGDGRFIGVLQTLFASDTSGTYTATLIRADGDTVFTRTFPFSDRRMSAERRATLVERLRIAPTAPPQAIAAAIRAQARSRMPGANRPVTDFFVGPDGSMWLFRPFEVGRTLLAWTVIDSAGRDVGMVRLPQAGRALAGTATHVWGKRSDADGVASVVRYRILR
jgi:hypothetical protein